MLAALVFSLSSATVHFVVLYAAADPLFAIDKTTGNDCHQENDKNHN